MDNALDFIVMATRLKGLYEGKFKNVVSNTLIDSKNLNDLNNQDIEVLNAFHAQKVEIIERNDDYLCGIRADHFVVETGYSELSDGVIYLISANHKGIRLVTMLEMIV